MKTETKRHFTYEEVRHALNSWLGGMAEHELKGVKISQESYYLVEECEAEKQPQEPQEPKPKETEAK